MAERKRRCGCCKTPRGWRGALGRRVLWTTPPCGEAPKGHSTPPIWAELSNLLSLLLRSLHPAAFYAGSLPRLCRTTTSVLPGALAFSVPRGRVSDREERPESQA